MTARVRVQKRGQITIPGWMREGLGVGAGDYLHVVRRGNRIILEPAPPETEYAADELTAEQRRALDARLEEGLADVKAGRVHGPFDSAREASEYIEKLVRERTAAHKSSRARR